MKRKKKRARLLKAKIPALIRKAHAAWSIYIRTRDRKCLMCGSEENLHAHHGIVPRKRGNSTRFLPDNGFTLCARCHMFEFHKFLGGKEWMDRFYKVVDRMVSKDKQEEIIRTSHESRKYSRDDLENIISFYTRLTSELDMQRKDNPVDMRLIEP